MKPGPRLPQLDGVLVGTQDRNQQRCCRLLVEMPSSRPSKLPKYWSHPGITKIWKKRLVYIGHPEYRDVVNKVERICETENLNVEVRDLYRCENDKAWYMYDNQFEARCPYLGTCCTGLARLFFPRAGLGFVIRRTPVLVQLVQQIK